MKYKFVLLDNKAVNKDPIEIIIKSELLIIDPTFKFYLQNYCLYIRNIFLKQDIYSAPIHQGHLTKNFKDHS